MLPGRCVPSQEHRQEQGEEAGLGAQASKGRKGHAVWQQLPQADSQLPLCCAGVVLRCARKVGNPLQTEKGSRPSCRYQERRRGSDEAVPGPSVLPSREPGVSGNFWAHPSILAWRIPQTEEPAWLQSVGLQRVGHDLATKHTEG